MTYTPRKKFIWVDPRSTKKKKYRVETTFDLKRLLEKVIETDEQAEDFFAAYAECCDSDEHAEYNIGYVAGLVSDPDIRDDILDLFQVDERLSPRQLFSRPYCLSESVRNGRG